MRFLQDIYSYAGTLGSKATAFSVGRENAPSAAVAEEPAKTDLVPMA
jgi:hypothetical protein